METGDLHGAVLADEDVVRADVADLAAPRVEVVGGSQQREGEVPELVLLEVLPVQTLAVVDFVAQQEGVVFEDELRGRAGTWTVPADPQ